MGEDEFTGIPGFTTEESGDIVNVNSGVQNVPPGQEINFAQQNREDRRNPTGPLPPKEESKPIIAAPEDSGDENTLPDVTETDSMAWAKQPGSGVVLNDE